ncbi:MAG: hypothetical protein DLM73_16840 [Chthoniobacterales bacterium]|nr:MAG: hypothetical protein DLM73_16840 [Chthoniobacterales bacterium]
MRQAFALLALIALSGCATSFEPRPVPADHPASAEAAEAPRPKMKRLATADELTRKTKAQLARQDVPTPDFQNSEETHDMKTMGQPKTQTAPKASYWTCVMHPEIHSDKPGQCPKCGMTLVKKEVEAK